MDLKTYAQTGRLYREADNSAFPFGPTCFVCEKQPATLINDELHTAGLCRDCFRMMRSNGFAEPHPQTPGQLAREYADVHYADFRIHYTVIPWPEWIARLVEEELKP
jgi:hypothetical protein